MKRQVHGVAGLVALAVITTFFASTVVAEVFGGIGVVAMVKRSILYGLIILVPSMAVAGGTGLGLAGARAGGKVLKKKRRMPIIGANGVLVLIPSAVILDRMAGSALAAGTGLGPAFYTLQAVELVAGGVNITLMALNARDGLAMAGGRGG